MQSKGLRKCYKNRMIRIIPNRKQFTQSLGTKDSIREMINNKYINSFIPNSFEA